MWAGIVWELKACVRDHRRAIRSIQRRSKIPTGGELLGGKSRKKTTGYRGLREGGKTAHVTDHRQEAEDDWVQNTLLLSRGTVDSEKGGGKTRSGSKTFPKNVRGERLKGERKISSVGSFLTVRENLWTDGKGAKKIEGAWKGSGSDRG